MPLPVRPVDLSDPESFADGVPHAFFRRLRAEAPVAFVPESKGGPGFWAVTRYHDVVHVSKHPRLFVSSQGTNIEDQTGEQLARLQTIMLNMDPPQHVKYRNLVRRGFTPRRIAALAPHVRELARRIVADVARKGECDFVAHVAAELPMIVICELMGVPQDDRHLLFELSNRLIGFDDPEFQTSPQDAERAAAEMWAYAHHLGQQRRARPVDDLISDLVGGEVDGHRLSELEFNNFFLLLAVAGNETTRNAISGGLLALLEHREQWERLLRQPKLAETAVDEIVRWVSPVLHFRRTASRDTLLGGVEIGAGEKVVVWYPSANRDEAVFPDGERFDVGRDPNPHLGFGVGEHFCLGSHLARLEMRILLEELVRQIPDVELAGVPRRLRSNFIHGIKELPIRFTPAEA
ncbi:MAG TPA: cytochrome P450 [Myxococcota bacterium]|nr:cytochrome P450 [Myxococcota bacterium]